MDDSEDSEIPIGIGVTLKGALDWRYWENALLALADLHGLSDHITKGKPVSEKPTKPELCYTRYEKTKKALADAVEVEGHLARHEDCTLYNLQHTDYLCQRSSVRKLGAWIHSTVTPDYIFNCCKANEELHQWYSNLNNHQSEELYRLTKSDEDEYLKLKSLSPPQRLEEAEAWLDKFEGVMNKFDRLGTPNGAGTWPRDLQRALSLVMPDFCKLMGYTTRVQIKMEPKDIIAQYGNTLDEMKKERREEEDTATPEGEHHRTHDFSSNSRRG